MFPLQKISANIKALPVRLRDVSPLEKEVGEIVTSFITSPQTL